MRVVLSSFEEGGQMRRYGLRDDQWERIKDLLPGREGHVDGTAADNRLCGSLTISLSRGHSMA